MPELPEVETVRRTLLLKLENRKIKDLTVFYDNIFKDQDIDSVIKNIKNQTINNIERRGKWLKFVLDDYYLLSHLRMEGKYLYRDIGSKIERHEHVIFNIDDDFELRYKDVRKFGKMYLVGKEDLENSPLKDLGFEPWDDMLNPDYLLKSYKNKKLPIKTLLLDQSIIVGIGNIYADEILFLSKINPYKKGQDLSFEECQKIIDNTKKVLEKAIEEGGTTIRSYTSSEGVTGLFQNSLNVHKQEGKKCPFCSNIIVREKINGRSTYYCTECQSK